jgi:glycosyltransferase involved in cell wall biosynthesis
MRIASASVQVPFIRGGAEGPSGSLRTDLEQRGRLTDIINIPLKWYPPDPLEAFWSHKPVITFPDSGEALQFVRDGENGYLVDGSAELADHLDRLTFAPGLTQRLGVAGFETIRKEEDIRCDRVIPSLTGVFRA